MENRLKGARVKAESLAGSKVLMQVRDDVHLY